MTKTTIGVLIGLFLLSISVTAQADLSPNLIQNGDFETSYGTGGILGGTSSGTSLISGQWYSWRSGNSPYWDNIKSSGGHNGPHYPQMQGGDSGTIQRDFLVQSFQISSVWPGGVASAGPVTVSLWYMNNMTNLHSVKLYGSNTQPIFGSPWNGGDDPSGYGTLLGTMTGFSTTSWLSNSLTFDAAAGYQWYTLDISGNGYAGSTKYFGVDDVSVIITGSGPSAVPIPAAIWLLGSGFLGIVLIRRRAKG
jgi:hypothetical protein